MLVAALGRVVRRDGQFRNGRVVDRDGLRCCGFVVAVVRGGPCANQRVRIGTSVVDGIHDQRQDQIFIRQIGHHRLFEHDVARTRHCRVGRHMVEHRRSVVHQMNDDLCEVDVAAIVLELQHAQVGSGFAIVQGVWLVGTST